MALVAMISFIIAFILGAAIGAHPNKKHPVGTLRIDRSDPEEAPYMFLELSTDPRNLMKEKQIVLDVNMENYLSQK